MNDRLYATHTDLAVGATLLSIDGVLDGANYRTLRDTIVEAAIDEPRAVLVDITLLAVPYESALAVFTSARWHIVRWPAVPLALVCGTVSGRDRLSRNGITRYVPVYPSIFEAIAALEQPLPGRRRMRAELISEWSSVARARDLVAEWLHAWSRPELTSSAKIVVTTLVENALVHSPGPTALRVENMGDDVAIAVEDPSAAPATFREDVMGAEEMSSLKIVDALCRAWGCSPTRTGKVVWCVVGAQDTM